ncbi:MAG TPA: branched-chain amino acid ABC transporter permease [Acidimicrobiia bacterium]|jgi:branched-chain amino acid transport system permease protein|nr:branched-chain amino acid ABC transporter permease [Acidimicrobiia bacterium]
MTTAPIRTDIFTRLARFPVRRTVLIVLGVIITVAAVAGARATLATGQYGSDVWRDLFIQGIARGSVYALIALGYTLVYGILLIINFAHGEVFMAGTFTTFFLATILANRGFLAANPALSLLIMLVTSALVSMGVALLLERIAYRPLRGAPRLVPLITAIGASLFLQYTFRGFYGESVKAYPTIPALQGQWDILGITIGRSRVVVIVGAIVLWSALYLFIERTKTGRAMRAVGEDREIASLMGVNVDRIIRTTFAIGGALAGAAGILFILLFNQVSFDMGFIPGLKAFTAAVLGGIGSITGAALGALILGIVEAVGPILFLTGAGIPSVGQLTSIVSFGILVLVLIFLPGGLLGAPEEKRA